MVDGKIINEDLIEKAKSDWDGKLNVFYIDVNEILLNQCKELRNMLDDYTKMPSSQKYDIIKNKIRTNRISVINFFGYNHNFYNRLVAKLFNDLIIV